MEEGDDSLPVNSESKNFAGIPLVSVITHPMIYVKVLIQVGYEPLQPKEITSFFGRKVQILPNFFQYASHVKDVDGWLGLYRGLTPQILFNFISTSISNSIDKKVEMENRAAGHLSADKETMKGFLEETWDLSVTKAFGILVGYPFQVISIRMMVQFVGKEKYYSSISSSFMEIYREEGVSGFFSGVVPYLMGELLSLLIFRILNHAMLSFIADRDNAQVPVLQNYSQAVSQFISTTLTYPFRLVANIMAVNGSRLTAAGPPLMPIYSSWTECWVDFGKKGLRNRGSRLFRRTVS